MDNLTKENFWNEIEQRFPDAMRLFGEWIDWYKQANDWNTLFTSNVTSFQHPSSKYKFHEIPGAMQLGIWMEYMMEGPMPSADIPLEMSLEDFDLREFIEGYLELHQVLITAGKEASKNAV